MMVREQYSVDQQKISEYFPLDPTIEGMMGIFAEIFGMKFHELSADERDCLSPTGKGGDLVWHEDVKVFSVWNDGDQGTGFLGYLYLDLHPRDGKYGHAANFNLWDGYTDKDGNRHYPATGQ